MKGPGLTGLSLDPSGSLVVVECPTGAPDQTACGFVNPNGPSTALLAAVSKGGTLNLRYAVTRGFWNETSHVDCTLPPGCSIGLIDPSSLYLGPTIPISFATVPLPLPADSRTPAAASGTVDGVATFLGRLDAWQQRRRAIAFLVAVFVRYREDRGRQFGALLSYYGFVSLFPLLLVLVTVLGIVLDDNADLRSHILDTVYARIPVVGAQLKESTASLDANGWALAFGLVVSIYAGLAVVKHAQDALNLQWSLPWYRRPRFVERNGRALGALAVVGLGIVVATVATGLAAFLPQLDGGGRWLGAALAIGINVLVLTMSFRVLVKGEVGWRALVPGGVIGGVALWALQLVGAEYVTRVVLDASEVYGTFAVMFGLLAWIALLARVILLANEVNVVRARDLWPRALLDTTPPSDGDRRAAAETVRRDALFAEAEAIAQTGESTGSVASSSRTRGTTPRP